MSHKKFLLWVMILFILSSLVVVGIGEEENDAPDDNPTVAVTDGTVTANVINDEGGPVLITGELTYTNPLFTTGVAQPVIILEDQTGFIDRNEFYVFPPESQVLGQITSDFFTSPFSYSLALPSQPQGGLRDVDNDGQEDVGVMVFSVAYWTNKFGPPVLEERDLFGGGWSTAYASTRGSEEVETRLEIVGGKFVIFAPEEGQGFPSGFGDDGLLFTEDDPIVTIPQGWSVVDLDVEPFTFDRSKEQTLDLFEPEGAAVNDFSDLSYSDAFDEMVDLFRKEYAYTEYYNLDWDDMHARYRPRFEAAELTGDEVLYARAMRDFLWEIPDGHVSMPLGLLIEDFRNDTDGGLGIALADLDDGRVVVNFLLEGSPAEQAGIQLGAEVIEWNGRPVDEVAEETFVWAHQAFGSPHARRLQQLRYMSRAPLGSIISVTYINPDSSEPVTAEMEVIAERQSWSFSSFFPPSDGTELPLEYDVLPSGYGYVKIYSFSDNEYLTVQLWERMIEFMNANEVPGLIIDMRSNGGGSGFLADQMAAYFFQEPHTLGFGGSYNEDLGEFYFDPRGEDKYILPPEELRYDGEVAVLIAPGCFSACEFFTYDMTIADRAGVVGFYPTGGLGGGVNDFFMPEDLRIRFTVVRLLDPDMNIHIEGKGVAPTFTVPRTLSTVLSTEDVILSAGVQYLDQAILGELMDGGQLALGLGTQEISANGIITEGQRVRYEVTLPANRVVSIFLTGANERVDTILRIYDATGQNQLGENDDISADNLNSALEDLDVGGQPIQLILEVGVKNTSLDEPFTLQIVDVTP